jgi:hypothetical protein
MRALQGRSAARGEIDQPSPWMQAREVRSTLADSVLRSTFAGRTFLDEDTPHTAQRRAARRPRPRFGGADVAERRIRSGAAIATSARSCRRGCWTCRR